MRRKKNTKVYMRPKIRRIRTRFLGLLMLGALGFSAVIYYARPAVSLLSKIHRPEWSVVRLNTISFSGIPQPYLEIVRQYANLKPGMAWNRGEASRLVSLLKSKFPFLRDIKPRRPFFSADLEVELVPRQAAAKISEEGAEKGYFDETGVIFSASEGFYPSLHILVDLPKGKAHPDSEAIASIARFLDEIRDKYGNIYAAINSVYYSAPKESWVFKLADGTEIIWGDFTLRDEKIFRLNQVLSDAKTKFTGGVSADLRFFDDGRILLAGTPASPH